MRPIANQEMSGYSLLEIGKFMREMADSCWKSSLLAARFKIEQKAAAKLVRVMILNGLVAKVYPQSNCREYEVTSKGFALGKATAGPPLKRVTAERLVAEFLERVENVNNDPDFLCSIDEVVAFGSFITNDPTPSEIDLAVMYITRVDPGSWSDLSTQRVESARARGRKFRSTSEEIAWPVKEIEIQLSGRAKALHIRDFNKDREFIESVPHQLIYRHRPVVGFGHLTLLKMSPEGSLIPPRNLENRINDPGPKHEEWCRWVLSLTQNSPDLPA
ncbi:MAG TPA: hypothetical protein VLL54_12955 [Pyrinomonadaceae bacterium]|nr:hypothetical protein [Pyrinomonadaceae bacterium]